MKSERARRAARERRQKARSNQQARQPAPATRTTSTGWAVDGRGYASPVGGQLDTRHIDDNDTPGGDWTVTSGQDIAYSKCPHDVLLKSGEVVHCWPNAGRFVEMETSRSWGFDEVEAIRRGAYPWERAATPSREEVKVIREDETYTTARWRWNREGECARKACEHKHTAMKNSVNGHLYCDWCAEEIGRHGAPHVSFEREA